MIRKGLRGFFGGSFDFFGPSDYSVASRSLGGLNESSHFSEGQVSLGARAGDRVGLLLLGNEVSLDGGREVLPEHQAG